MQGVSAFFFAFPMSSKECVASMAGRLENKMCYIGEYNEK
jgi:hypothetical protein